MKKIQILTLGAFTVRGCILETDVANSRSSAQNAASGVMKGVEVQAKWKTFLCFSPATLSKSSCHSTLTTVFGKTYVGHLESKERLRVQPAQLFNFS